MNGRIAYFIGFGQLECREQGLLDRLMMKGFFNRVCANLIDRPCAFPGQRHHLCIDLPHRESGISKSRFGKQFLTTKFSLQCVIQAIQTRSRFVDVSSSVEDGIESPGIESSAPSRGRRPNARGIYKRFLQAFFSAAMLSAKIGGVAGQTYSEELTLKPLPNGKMSLLFDFEMEGPSGESDQLRCL